MPNGWGHSGAEYRKLWEYVMNARPLVCWLCTGVIDPSLKYPDPGSRALHCVLPVSKGGALDRTNCVPTHRQCNLRQGDRLPDEGPFTKQWVSGLEP